MPGFHIPPYHHESGPHALPVFPAQMSHVDHAPLLQSHAIQHLPSNSSSYNTDSLVHDLQTKIARLTTQLSENDFTIHNLKTELTRSQTDLSATLKTILLLTNQFNGPIATPAPASDGLITVPATKIDRLERDILALHLEVLKNKRNQAAVGDSGGLFERLDTFLRSLPTNLVPQGKDWKAETQLPDRAIEACGSESKILSAEHDKGSGGNKSNGCDFEAKNIGARETDLLSLDDEVEPIGQIISPTPRSSVLPERELKAIPTSPTIDVQPRETGGRVVPPFKRYFATTPRPISSKFQPTNSQQNLSAEDPRLQNPTGPAIGSARHDGPEFVFFDEGPIEEDSADSAKGSVDRPNEVTNQGQVKYPSHDHDLPTGPKAMLPQHDILARDGYGRLAHRNSHGRAGFEHHPLYLEFGIQYIPKERDSNHCRTVILDNLPVTTKLADILEHAKEFPLVSSQLVDTSKMKVKGEIQPLGTVTVVLVFFYEVHARQFEFEMKGKEPKNKSHPPRVTLLSSPTYPSVQEMRAYDCPIGRLMTRRILMRQPQMKFEYFLNALEGYSKGFRENGWIVECEQKRGGLLEITFNSIDTAIYAFHRMKVAHDFAGCQPNFVRDHGDRDDGDSANYGAPKLGTSNTHQHSPSASLAPEYTKADGVAQKIQPDQIDDNEDYDADSSNASEPGGTRDSALKPPVELGNQHQLPVHGRQTNEGDTPTATNTHADRKTNTTDGALAVKVGEPQGILTPQSSKTAKASTPDLTTCGNSVHDGEEHTPASRNGLAEAFCQHSAGLQESRYSSRSLKVYGNTQPAPETPQYSCGFGSLKGHNFSPTNIELDY